MDTTPSHSGSMLRGYTLILAAATIWGLSVVAGKGFIKYGWATPLLITQARVLSAWVLLFVYLLARDREKLRVHAIDLWHFSLLGVIGVVGTSFFLYYAIAGMDAAVADVIQFTAPVLVVLWMWMRGAESLDRPKLVALALSVIGCGLSVGLLDHAPSKLPAIRIGSAGLAALCDAFLYIYGKRLSQRYPSQTFLHYALLAASVFWIIVLPPWIAWPKVDTPGAVPVLLAFGAFSMLLPYWLFFSGLRHVAASRAAILGTWEPVSISVAAWLLLSEALSPSQITGIVLVLAAIVVVEAFPAGASASKTAEGEGAGG